MNQLYHPSPYNLVLKSDISGEYVDNLYFILKNKLQRVMSDEHVLAWLLNTAIKNFDYKIVMQILLNKPQMCTQINRDILIDKLCTTDIDDFKLVSYVWHIFLHQNKNEWKFSLKTLGEIFFGSTLSKLQSIIEALFNAANKEKINWFYHHFAQLEYKTKDDSINPTMEQLLGPIIKCRIIIK